MDDAEIARFSAMAEAWWDPQGEFRPLHQLNPVRLSYIRERAVTHFRLDGRARRPLAGLRLLDIGCGGGLLSEPMARLGADVLGADAAERNVRVAAEHARQSGLVIDYRHASAEDLAAAGERFDMILAMEIVEHVTDLDAFVAALGGMLRPDGLLLAATLNRTVKSFALAIVGAEYLLGWLPRGTHDWSRFVRPHELARAVRRSGLVLDDLTGVSYEPLAGRWSLGASVDVNYLASCSRP